MSHPEVPVDYEPAGQEDLGRLYHKASTWLRANGSYFYEPAYKILGEHNNLPVLEVQACFNFRVPLADLIERAPEAALNLSVGGPVEIAFWEPCYCIAGDGMQYQDPDVSFHIPQSSDAPVRRLTLSIQEIEAGKFESRRNEEPWSRPNLLADSTVEEAFGQLVANFKLQHQTGFDIISAKEYIALDQIVDVAQQIAGS